MGPFDPISLYNDKYGYMGSLFMIQYNENSLKTAVPDEFISTRVGSRYGLDSQTRMNPVQFTFQNIPYDTGNKFALAKGVYTLYNTTDIPVTLLNTGKKEWIEIEGISKNIVDGVLGVGPQGEECIFYYGTIRIRVFGDFGQCSLYTPRTGINGGGYRGGHGIFVYDETFSNVPSYTAREMIPPTIVPNNTICTIGLETFKPYSLVVLPFNEFTLNIGELFRGTTKYGDAVTYEMRFKLTPNREYAFTFNGIVTVYGTNAIPNTYTIGTVNYREFNRVPTYPIYQPAPSQTNTTFFVRTTAREDFFIVHQQGNSVYSYFMTYQNL
jgi:hypothetical protein